MHIRVNVKRFHCFRKHRHLPIAELGRDWNRSHLLQRICNTSHDLVDRLSAGGLLPRLHIHHRWCIGLQHASHASGNALSQQVGLGRPGLKSSSPRVVDRCSSRCAPTSAAAGAVKSGFTECRIGRLPSVAMITVEFIFKWFE